MISPKLFFHSAAKALTGLVFSHKSTFLLFMVFAIPLTHEAQPSLNFETTSIPSGWDDFSVNLGLQDFMSSEKEEEKDRPERYIVFEKNQISTVSQDGVENTIFIGGAGFKGKIKKRKRKGNFTNHLGCTFEEYLEKHDFKVGKKNKRFLGVLRNSVYSLKFGHKLIDSVRIGKGKHKPLRRTLDQIGFEYPFNSPQLAALGEPDVEPVNLVGSSFGSVLAAHAAIFLCDERGIKIKSLTLSASPIDSTNGLGLYLENLRNQGKIDTIIYHPNAGDNYTGASGKKTVWNLLFPKRSEGVLSIMNIHHPHNEARSDTSRVEQILFKTIGCFEAEGEAASKRVKERTRLLNLDLNCEL